MTLAATATLASSAFAASVVYTDRSAFEIAAAPVTVDAGAPSISDFGITNVSGSTIVIGNYSNTMPGDELAVSGVENFDITFNTTTFVNPIFSFGFDFIEPTGPQPQFNSTTGCNTTSCVDSTFEFTLLSGTTAMETLSFRPVVDAAQDQIVFFGFQSDTAFTGLRVREVVGSNDNEMFQNFTVGTSALTPVPLPAPAALLLAALALIGAVARRGAVQSAH
jgi:hypothetical protein